jgi:hypothetical protein
MSTESTTRGDCLGTCMGVALPEDASTLLFVHPRTEEQFDAILEQLVERFSVEPRRASAYQRSVHATDGNQHDMTVIWQGPDSTFDDTIDAKLAALKFVELPSLDAALGQGGR